MTKPFKTPISAEQGILLPGGAHNDVWTRDTTGGAGYGKWVTPFRYPPIGAVLAGTTTAAVGTGAFITPVAGTIQQQNPAGSATNGWTWTCPGNWPGLYKVSMWVQLQNASAGRQAGARALLNGGAVNSAVANGIARVYNGIAAMWAAAGGFVFANLAGGDVITAQTMHDDTGARSVAWILEIEWVN